MILKFYFFFLSWGFKYQNSLTLPTCIDLFDFHSKLAPWYGVDENSLPYIKSFFNIFDDVWKLEFRSDKDVCIEVTKQEINILENLLDKDSS